MGRQLELATLKAAVAASRSLSKGAWLDLNVSPDLVMESVELAHALRDVERPIVLEVTEHEQIDDYEQFRSAADSLGQDVRIAVDDAGSGYASLRHILELRPALVKLDRGLIMGIESDHARRALVAGMRRFAGEVDIQLVAEGIETQGGAGDPARPRYRAWPRLPAGPATAGGFSRADRGTGRSRGGRDSI